MIDATEEVWVPIEGFEHYQISNHGRIYSHRSGRFLKPKAGRNRSARVGLYEGSELRSYKEVHVLVLEHFNPDYRHGIRVVFLDGDRSNARVDNLYLIDWVSKEPREPKPMKRRHIRKVRVVDWDTEYDSVRELTDDIGGDISSVYRVLRGDARTHLGLSFEYVK